MLRTLPIAALAPLLALLFGCAPKEALPPPLAEMPGAFSPAGAAPMPDRWWTALGDPTLDALVDEALRTNFTLRSAWARLRAAEAVIRRASGGLFPRVDAFGEVSDSTPFGDPTLEVGVAAAYEVDLWGRVRSGVRADRERARASHADVQAAAIGVAAEVARTWIALEATREQLDLLEQQVAANERMTALMDTRFRNGISRQTDVLRQQRLLGETREQQIVAGTTLPILEHRLAVLLGRAPQAGIEAEPAPLPALPPLPEAGIPLELVRRRPDVRSAHHALQASDAEVAVAVANTFPRLDLRGSVASSSADALFQTWVTSLAAGLVAPLFAAGERRAEVKRARAVREQHLYAYGDAVLTAFQEVEDALVREQRQAERIANLASQVDLSTRTTAQLTAQYTLGVVPYLDVLTSQSTEQRLGRDLIAARQQQLEIRIDLYRALAGGFETEQETQ